MTISKKKKNDAHYVDNEEFYLEMIEWVLDCEKSERESLPRPQLTTPISKKIMLVCRGTAYRHNFNQYTFVEEFVGDAIEHCVKYAHNFKFRKYNSPYSYFSKIAWQASVRRIQKEDKNHKIKLKYMMNIDVDGVINELQSHDNGVQYNNDYIKFLKDLNDERKIDLTIKGKKKRITKTNSNSLEDLLNG